MSGATHFRVTFTAGARKSLSLVVGDLTLKDLSALLSEFHVGAKAEALAIIPGEMGRCPPLCRNHLRAKISNQAIDCGGSKHHRLAANVVSIALLGIDADDWSVQQRDACLDKIEAKGFTFWAHSTSSYEPPTAAKSRIYIPFSSALSLANSREWRDRFRPKAFRLVGLEDLANAADPACSDPSRLYFLPRKPSSASPWFSRHFLGRSIDVAELTRAAPKLHFVTSAAITSRNNELNSQAEPGSVALEPLRSLMRSYCRNHQNSQRGAVVRRALAGEPLAEDGARDDSIHRLVSTLAFVLPASTPKEVVMEIIRPSIMSLPGEPHESGMTWMEIADGKWERATADRHQADAEKAALAAAVNARFFPPRALHASSPRTDEAVSQRRLPPGGRRG